MSLRIKAVVQLRERKNMNESISIWRTTFSEVWRLTHLYAGDGGPRELLVRISSSIAERLMNCIYCLSLWFSHPLAIWLSTGWVGLLLHWQALCGSACRMEKSARRRSQVWCGMRSRKEKTQCAALGSDAAMRETSCTRRVARRCCAIHTRLCRHLSIP